MSKVMPQPQSKHRLTRSYVQARCMRAVRKQDGDDGHFDDVQRMSSNGTCFQVSQRCLYRAVGSICAVLFIQASSSCSPAKLKRSFLYASTRSVVASWLHKDFSYSPVAYYYAHLPKSKPQRWPSRLPVPPTSPTAHLHCLIHRHIHNRHIPLHTVMSRALLPIQQNRDAGLL